MKYLPPSLIGVLAGLLVFALLMGVKYFWKPKTYADLMTVNEGPFAAVAVETIPTVYRVTDEATLHAAMMDEMPKIIIFDFAEPGLIHKVNGRWAFSPIPEGNR